MKNIMSLPFLSSRLARWPSRQASRVSCSSRTSPPRIIAAARAIVAFRVASIPCIACRHLRHGAYRKLASTFRRRSASLRTWSRHATKAVEAHLLRHWLIVPFIIFSFVSCSPACAPLMRSESRTSVCTTTRMSAASLGSSGARPAISPKSMEPLRSMSKRLRIMFQLTLQSRPGACSAERPRSQSSLWTEPASEKSSMVSSVTRNDMLCDSPSGSSSS